MAAVDAAVVSTEELRAARRHGYDSERPDVLALVPRSARAVLDLPAIAAERLDRVELGDVETFCAGPPPDEAPFDCLVCADVLEHLVDPWTALERASAWLAPGATVVISLPNVLWYRNLRRLVRHRSFPRDAVGQFDRTHLRWFSLSDAKALLEGAGLTVTAVDLRFWELRPNRLRLLRALARTKLEPYLAGQHVLAAVKPGR